MPRESDDLPQKEVDRYVAALDALQSALLAKFCLRPPIDDLWGPDGRAYTDG